jgi:hypothetical protein
MRKLKDSLAMVRNNNLNKGIISSNINREGSQSRESKYPNRENFF